MSKLQPILRFSCRYLSRRHVVSVANISGSSDSNSLSKQPDAFDLMKPSLTGLMEDIHCQLESDLVLETELGELSRYVEQLVETDCRLSQLTLFFTADIILTAEASYYGRV